MGLEESLEAGSGMMVAKGTTLVDVVFRLANGLTEWGEMICVVGDSEELGCWDPAKAVRLNTDATSYPQWHSSQVSFRLQSPGPEVGTGDPHDEAKELKLRYKFLRKREEGYAWEDLIEDRKVVITPTPGSRSAWVIEDDTFNMTGAAELVETTPLKVPTPPTMHMETPESTPEPDRPTPRMFEDMYLLIGGGSLAEGGFSTVWRCRPRLEGGCSGLRDRAVKRIAKSWIPEGGNRFLYGRGAYAGEIEVHRNLWHPNVVRLFEVFDDSGTVSLVMEYCRGGDLLEIVLNHHQRYSRGLYEPAAVAVARQLFAALGYLHNEGIIHRDVKAENVLQLEEQGKVPLERATFQLGDFGLAARVQPDEVLLEQVGSPSTSAPEVVHGRPYAAPADVWSAGATLFTAIAARRPFEASSYAQMMKRADKGRVVFEGCTWDHVSGDVKSLLRGLMHPCAGERPCARAVLQLPWLRE